MKRNTGIHIRLTTINSEKILKLSKKYNMTYNSVVNQLLDQIDPGKLKEEVKIETQTVTIKKIIL